MKTLNSKNNLSAFRGVTFISEEAFGRETFFFLDFLIFFLFGNKFRELLYYYIRESAYYYFVFFFSLTISKNDIIFQLSRKNQYLAHSFWFSKVQAWYFLNLQYTNTLISPAGTRADGKNPFLPNHIFVWARWFAYGCRVA